MLKNIQEWTLLLVVFGLIALIGTGSAMKSCR